LRVPRFALKTATGELAGELLGSLRVRPQRLLDAGFTFEHPDVESIVSAALAG
jgi:NAD dependent epimerase/dehydratase family enzyme